MAVFYGCCAAMKDMTGVMGGWSSAIVIHGIYIFQHRK